MVVLITTGVMFMTSLVFAASTDVNNNVLLEATGQLGRVVWDQGTIEAIGTGLPPSNMGLTQGRLLARRAAIVDAYRNLAEVIQGVQVDSETIMSNLTISSDLVRTRVSGLIRGARVIREQNMPDGSYQVVMSIPLYGQDSLADVAFNAIKPEKIQEFPAPIFNRSVNNPTHHRDTNISQYTGVIVDARGLGLESTFSPRIYDETGRIVYGNLYIDTNFAISQGMVDYTLTPDMVQAAESGQSRAGAYPLVVKAIRVTDANNCNIVISNGDANTMLAANRITGFLKRCAVVFER